MSDDTLALQEGENIMAWLQCIPHGFKNVNRIFPTQQSDVKEMIDVCKEDRNVKKIIIFGSSVTSRCNPWSDIDIYYEFEKEPKKYPSTGSATAVFDKWDNFNVNNELLHEIRKNGVVVYER